MIPTGSTNMNAEQEFSMSLKKLQDIVDRILTYDESQNKCPDRQLCRPDMDTDDTDDEGEQEDREIPPLRN